MPLLSEINIIDQFKIGIILDPFIIQPTKNINFKNLFIPFSAVEKN
jgi:hypothetical protein